MSEMTEEIDRILVRVRDNNYCDRDDANMLCAEVKSLRAEVLTRGQYLAQYDDDCRALRASLAAATAERDAARAHLAATTDAALKLDERMVSDINRMRAEIETLTKERDAAHARETDIQKDVADLSALVFKAGGERAQIETLKQERDAAQAEAAQHRLAVMTALAEEKKLQADVEGLEASLRFLNAELSIQEGTIDALVRDGRRWILRCQRLLSYSGSSGSFAGCLRPRPTSWVLLLRQEIERIQP